MEKKRIRLSLIALLLCLCTTLSSYAYLKIDTTKSPVINTFTYSSNGSLLEDDSKSKFTLLESVAKKQADGNYILDTDSTTTSNTYDVLPGMTLLKDPYITITGKNNIPAYLYVEVKDGLKNNSHFSYSVSSAFEKMTLTNSTHTDDVYVYKVNNSYLINDQSNLSKIYILKDNHIIVDNSDNLEVKDNTTLTFNAYLTQASIDSDPAKAFVKAFG